MSTELAEFARELRRTIWTAAIGVGLLAIFVGYLNAVTGDRYRGSEARRDFALVNERINSLAGRMANVEAWLRNGKLQTEGDDE